MGVVGWGGHRFQSEPVRSREDILSCGNGRRIRNHTSPGPVKTEDQREKGQEFSWARLHLTPHHIEVFRTRL